MDREADLLVPFRVYQVRCLRLLRGARLPSERRITGHEEEPEARGYVFAVWQRLLERCLCDARWIVTTRTTHCMVRRTDADAGSEPLEDDAVILCSLPHAREQEGRDRGVYRGL